MNTIVGISEAHLSGLDKRIYFTQKGLEASLFSASGSHWVSKDRRVVIFQPDKAPII